VSVVQVSDDEFEGLVAEALDGIPPELANLIDNCVVLVEPEPPADDPDLLGLYDGIPLTERDSSYTFRVPDRILVYRGPLTRMCASAEELVEEVRITVVHEIAHHFGIDDERLHGLGYG
jgi:predicted Zn-dependent protease with MMP-like domain